MSNSKTISKRFVTAFEHLYDSKVVTNKSALAKEMGRTPQSFNETLKGRTNVGLEMLYFFFSHFKLNPRYVFFGEKPMFIEESAEQNNNRQNSSKTNRTFLSINTIEEFGQLEELEQSQVDITAIHDCDYVISVANNAILAKRLGNKYFGLQAVSLKKLNPNDTFIFLASNGSVHISKFVASSTNSITTEDGETLSIDSIQQIFSLVNL